MKGIGVGFIACALALSLGCNKGRSDNTTATDRQNGAVGTVGERISNGTERFITNAVNDGMAEVELGRYATEHASSPEVKRFAEMMVRDHTKAGDELKQKVSRFNVQVPTQLDDKHRDQIEKLQQEQGADFDRDYMKMMVDDHQDAVDMLDSKADDANKPAKSGRDGELDLAVSEWASQALPTVQDHLRMAREINQHLSDTKASSRANTADRPYAADRDNRPDTKGTKR